MTSQEWLWLNQRGTQSHDEAHPALSSFFSIKGMIYLMSCCTYSDLKLATEITNSLRRCLLMLQYDKAEGCIFFHRLQFSWISFCSWMSCLRLAIRGKKCRFKTICIIFSFQTWKLCTSFLYSLWEKIKQTVTLFICECFGEGLLSSDMWRLIWLALLIAKTF